MTNLLIETIEDISASGHTPEDIVFIGSRASEHRCTWDEFRVLADREYNDEEGGQKVADDLCIMFSDGHMMMRGYNEGCEWWEYHLPFVEPLKSLPIRNLFAEIGWDSLETLNP